jgi:hypothetical protein
MFRGHVMGIPVDYKDADYKGKVPLLPKVLMLPLTKEQLALQECVGVSAKRCSPTQVRQTKLGTDQSRGKEERLDVEVRPLTTGFELQAPIRMVDGHLWNPGVYQLLHLLGKTLEVVWERAFIQTSHF